MLDKNTNIQHFRYIFFNYVHCDMGCLDIKIGALLCFINGCGIAVPVFSF